MIKVSFLDGGMIFELNKLYSDLGQEAVMNNKNKVVEIYQKYIDLGCNYITSCNYGFKPARLNNWKELVNEMIIILKNVKNKNPNIKILGSLPPYHSSYHEGTIDSGFIDFYNYLISNLSIVTNEFIIETSVSAKHIDAICSLTYSNIHISIYPHNKITLDEINNIIKKYNNIQSLLVNCCDFNSFQKFFDNIISKIDKKLILGFYLNKIDELKYNSNNQSIKDLNTYINDDKLEFYQLYNFFKNSNYKNLIIGGCCGYGVKEMAELIPIVKKVLHKINTNN